MYKNTNNRIVSNFNPDRNRNNRRLKLLNHILKNRVITRDDMDKLSFNNPELAVKKIAEKYSLTVFPIDLDTWELVGEMKYPAPKPSLTKRKLRKYCRHGHVLSENNVVIYYKRRSGELKRYRKCLTCKRNEK